MAKSITTPKGIVQTQSPLSTDRNPPVTFPPDLEIKSSESNHTKRVDFVSDTEMYIGYAAVGSLTSAQAWRIKHILINNSAAIETYADGTDLYTKVWDDRASYTYS